VVLGWLGSLVIYAFNCKLKVEYFFFVAMFIIVLLFAFFIIFVLFMKSNGNKKIWMVNRQGEIEDPENKWE
jgi:cell division protein FtsL